MIIGTFEVITNRIYVTDPCYDEPQQIIEGCLSGKWIARRASKSLICYSESVSQGTRFDEDAGLVDVDSGQIGVFGDEMNWGEGEYDDKDHFYGACCALSLSDERCGIFYSVGVVTRTNHGDGTYQLKVRRNARGEAVALQMELE